MVKIASPKFQNLQNQVLSSAKEIEDLGPILWLFRTFIKGKGRGKSK